MAESDALRAAHSLLVRVQRLLQEASDSAYHGYESHPCDKCGGSGVMVTPVEHGDPSAVAASKPSRPQTDSMRDAKIALIAARRIVREKLGDKPRGRPFLRFDHEQAKQLFRDGHTERSAAKILGIAHQTLHRYKKQWHQRSASR